MGAAAVGVALLRTPGLAAHSREAVRPALGTVADLVHLLGAAVWLGGLVFVVAVVLPRRDVDELAAVIPKYSWMAFGSMAAIAAAGAFMSWQLVGGLHGLIDSPADGAAPSALGPGIERSASHVGQTTFVTTGDEG